MIKEIEGYNGKYLADSDGYIISANYRCRKNNGKLLKEWNTAKEAADKLKLNVYSLRWCASYSKNKVYNGYIWEWKKN